MIKKNKNSKVSWKNHQYLDINFRSLSLGKLSAASPASVMRVQFLTKKRKNKQKVKKANTYQKQYCSVPNTQGGEFRAVERCQPCVSDKYASPGFRE